MTQQLLFTRLLEPNNPNQTRNFRYNVTLDGKQLTELRPCHPTPVEAGMPHGKRVFTVDPRGGHGIGMSIRTSLPLNLMKVAVRDFLTGDDPLSWYNLTASQFRKKAALALQRDRKASPQARRKARRLVRFKILNEDFRFLQPDSGKSGVILYDGVPVTGFWSDDRTPARHSRYQAYSGCRELRPYEQHLGYVALPFQRYKAMLRHIVANKINCYGMSTPGFQELAEFAFQQQAEASRLTKKRA